MTVRRSRRAIGAAICLSPVALVLSSLFLGSPSQRDANAGLALVGLALAVALVNVWCSIGRYALHRALGKSRDTFRFKSGVPGIGTFLVIAAVLRAFGHTAVGLLALVVLVIDTGGAPWFLLSTWRDDSLWTPASRS